MGGFYGSIQVRTSDRDAVKRAVEAVAGKKSIRCLIGPALMGWVGVYPDGSGQDGSVGAAIAERVGGYAIHLLVHDDDILAYWLWSDGRLLDRYYSSPGYFGEQNQVEEEKLVGDPKQFAFVLDESGQAKLAKVIDREAKVTFEVERLRRLCRLLEIENGLTSYEYLKEDEGSPIKGRRQFIELPADDAAAKEKVAQAAASKQIRDERKRLKSAGLLLARFEDGAFCEGVNAVADGFVRFPAPWYYEKPSSLHFHSPPWKGPTFVGFDLPPRSNAFNICTNSSGRRVAAQADAAIRIWDWNGTEARHVIDLPTSQFASVLAISDDGTRIAETRKNGANSNHEIAVHDVELNRVIATIGMEDIGEAAFSPDGETLLVAAKTFEWIDLKDQPVRRTFHIGGVTSLIRERRAEADKAIAEISKATTGGNVRTAAEVEQIKKVLEKHLAQTERQLKLGSSRDPSSALPVERTSCVGFSRDGRWVWCGTDRGLRVFETSGFSNAQTILPQPVWTAAPWANSSGYSHVHSIVEEPGGRAVIFGGWGPKVMRLELETGDVQTLIEIPEATFITGIAICLDGPYLGVSANNNQVRGKKLKNWFEIWNFTQLRVMRAQFD